jgi:hypothetical protein
VLKQDYVLRLIEQLVRAVHHALGLRNEGRPEEALEAIDNAFSDLFGWDSNFANAMPEEYLIGMMRNGERVDANRLIVLAALLKAEGDIHEGLNAPEKAYHRHLRALHFILAAHESDVPLEIPEEYTRVDEAVASLDAYELPRETLHRLWHHYTAQGQYADAEDTLWRLMEPEDAALVEEAIVFYRGLLQKSDEALSEGGLPREEIEDALRELRTEDGGR